MTQKNQVDIVELPQDELIAWISKQLSLGVRATAACDPENGVAQAIPSIERAFELKKEIVKTSKQISSYINNIMVEEWRLVEAELAVLEQETKLAENVAILENVKKGNFSLSREKLGSQTVSTVNVALDGTAEYLANRIDIMNEFRNRIESLWKQIETNYEEDLLARKAEDELLESDGVGNRNFVTSLSSKRQIALDECLNERFLLKRQQERRSETESELRRELAALSSQLHARRDLDRVKEAVDGEDAAIREAQQESQDRETEWKLMDEEINLNRRLKNLSEKFAHRHEKISHEMAKVEQMYYEERDFVENQMRGIDFFKTEISGLRLEVKEIEQMVSRFKSYLRHAKREERIVRE